MIEKLIDFRGKEFEIILCDNRPSHTLPTMEVSSEFAVHTDETKNAHHEMLINRYINHIEASQNSLEDLMEYVFKKY